MFSVDSLQIILNLVVAVRSRLGLPLWEDVFALLYYVVASGLVNAAAVSEVCAGAIRVPNGSADYMGPTDRH